MSEFERGLQAARARQMRFYLAGLVAIVLVVLVVVGVLVSTNATGVRILPEEAEITGTVEVRDGFALIVGNTVYSVSRSPVIAVRAEGYREAEREILPDERGRRIEVTLTPLPARIVATTEPAGPRTRWKLDGVPVAVGAAVDIEMEAGSYTLSADHPFFQPLEHAFEIARAEQQDVTLPLEPVAGRLTVTSRPSGAVVRIDGQPAGRTPTDISLAGGSYSVSLEATDRQILEDTVEITNAKPNANRNYALLPFPATLTFSLKPTGGQLLLDGRGVSPAGPVTISARTDHKIVYVVDGYHGVTQTVNLAPNETRAVSLDLKPKLGIVEIQTSPAARIIVDGRERGEGSATLSLLAVPHRIELRKPGYRTIVKTIVPNDARRQVIRETLITEAAARLAEAPKTYTNGAGVELVLFEPGPFVMGAPRHEKGQRANEFEKRVRLTKPFYAAKHEVTNGQVAKFRGGSGRAANEPATGMSWNDAAAFANWLSAAEGLSPFYRMSGGRVQGVSLTDGYRLLTEAEWEWLARSAGRPGQTVFTWGDSDVIPKRSGNIADESANGLARNFVPNYNDGHARIAPVGSFSPEKSGLFDLTGNVREWVHDWYSLEPPGTGTEFVDPLGPTFGDSRVVKGSSWRSGTRTTLRAAYRDGLTEGSDDVGFRIGRYLLDEDATQ